MSQDFLHNLITRHRGLEPILQPRPASRFESTQNVQLGGQVEESIRSASEFQHFQQWDNVRNETQREPRAEPFLQELSDQQASPTMTAPSITNDVAAEQKTQPAYSAFQPKWDSPRPSVTHQDSVMGPWSFNEPKAQIRSSDISSSKVADTLDLSLQRITEPFDIAELADLLGREKSIEGSGDSSNRKVSEHRRQAPVPTRDMVTHIESDKLDRNIDYHDLRKIVQQLRDELANSKEKLGPKTLAEQNLIVPPFSVPTGTPLYGAMPDNAFRREPDSRVTEANPEPVINVTIGRIEVRAIRQPDPTKRRQTSANAVMSLNDYLHKRGGGKP